MVKENTPVLIMGTGKAVIYQQRNEHADLQSAFHNGIAQSYGTNIVSACAPGKGGSTFLSKPVFGSLKEALSSGETPRPEVVSVFVPPKSAADAVIECIEHEVPLVVAYAEGVPTQDQLRVRIENNRTDESDTSRFTVTKSDASHWTQLPRDNSPSLSSQAGNPTSQRALSWQYRSRITLRHHIL